MCAFGHQVFEHGVEVGIHRLAKQLDLGQFFYRLSPRVEDRGEGLIKRHQVSGRRRLGGTAVEVMDHRIGDVAAAVLDELAAQHLRFLFELVEAVSVPVPAEDRGRRAPHQGDGDRKLPAAADSRIAGQNQTCVFAHGGNYITH